MTTIDPDDAAAVRNIRKARAILHDWGWDPEKALRYLVAGNLIANPPRIIRTRHELAALDPDTVVTDGILTVAANLAALYAQIGMLGAPVVVIATGDQVRAALQALEATDDTDR